MKDKLGKLRELISSCGRLAVAFSGGADSAFLLAAAHEALGDGAAAFIAEAPLFPGSETRAAKEFCAGFGIRANEVPIDPLSLKAFSENPPDRCYHCKRLLMGEIKKAAAALGFSALAEGSNADDGNDHRPGIRAVRELGILSPLSEAGLTKSEIRALSKEMGLPTWDKPSMACLATRFPYGDAVTEEGLRAVEKAEEYLRGKGIRQLRVRVHGSIARIETEPAYMELILSNREEIAGRLRGLGFAFAALDLEGFASGSMNRMLPGRGDTERP